MSADTESKKPVRPEKPDEEKFKADLEAAQKEHDAVRTQLNDIKAKLDSAKPGARTPREREIRDELATIKSAVAAKKSASQKLSEQIRALQDTINTRVKELQTKQRALPYRTLGELEDAVAALDKKVASGMMKIVDEKKALQEISTLNKQKRNFAVIEDLQKAIDADRQKLKELKDRKVDPEQAALNARFDALNAELAGIRAEQDAAHKNLNALRDERSRLQRLQNEKWEAIKALKDGYHQARIAHREYTREARRLKEERYQRERAEKEKARKLALANEKMEEASAPAFQAEIITCENLIGFFDPGSAEALRKEKTRVVERALAAKPARAVDTEIKGRVLKREEEDFFVGTGGKKKGRKAARKDGEEPAHTKEKESVFKIDQGTLESLARIGVETPGSKEEVPVVLEKLREKLKWYKDNQERVTQENIAKAKKELEKLEEADKEEKKEAAAPEETKEEAAASEETKTE